MFQENNNLEQLVQISDELIEPKDEGILALHDFFLGVKI